jgi:iron complex outermembrane receptor protein
MKLISFLFLIPSLFFSVAIMADEGLSLREIYVITDVVTPGEITSGESISSSKLNQQFKQDTSSLLEYFTGIDNAANGSVSSIPYMQGLNDDRIRISVDGVDLNSAWSRGSANFKRSLGLKPFHFRSNLDQWVTQ